MIGASPPVLTGIALALAVLASWLRLMRRRTRGELAGTPLRFALRLLLQPALAALLFFGLFPPRAALPEASLLVFTARATDLAKDRMLPRIALPEAPSDIAAERVPDLATALRRHPQATSLRVRGEGLPARDIEAARELAIVPGGDAPAQGLVELHAPSRVAAGNGFALHGRVAGVPNARVSLLDPAGEPVAQARTDASGRFALAGTARAAGLARFALRLTNAVDGSERERLPLPIRVDAPAPPRVLVLGGAPNAELKYLRRWASDSGAALRTRIGTGAGMTLGDALSALDAAALGTVDLVVLDARSLAALDAATFAALGAALDAGLGVLVRIDAPPAARASARLRDWGLELEGGADPVAAHLPSRDEEDAGTLPVLTRIAISVRGEDAALLLRDSHGEALGHWRARGRGRLGLISLVDSYRLVLTGHRERHGTLWAGVFATLARATEAPARVDITQPLWPGERIALCGLADGAQVIDPAGAVIGLAIDPATGSRRCAAFWPAREGWHRLRDGEAEAPFAVLPAAAGRAWQAQRRHDATTALAALSSQGNAKSVAPQPGPRGSPWPWLAGWLVLATLAWWMERREARPAASPDR